MKISLIVPTLGERKNEIQRLLNSLRNQTYKEFETIFITQGHHEEIKKIINDFNDLEVYQVCLNVKGISIARNRGIEKSNGEIIVLSDDDCWYPANALENINNFFNEDLSTDIVLTQIYDPEIEKLYKNYSPCKHYIKYRFQLASKSSIEIAFKKNRMKDLIFDEQFGLGSKFVCGEEVDFLLRNYTKRKIYYVPLITVYHKKKEKIRSKAQIIAKGALYAKSFNLFICLIVLIRDLTKKKENNFKDFFEGYYEYLKGKN